MQLAGRPLSMRLEGSHAMLRSLKAPVHESRGTDVDCQPIWCLESLTMRALIQAAS